MTTVDPILETNATDRSANGVAASTPASPVRLSRTAGLVAQNAEQVHIRGLRGPAGCGKSFALTARAARLAAVGRRVLILSFNQTLANHLRHLVEERCAESSADPSFVTCTSFHTFCATVVDDAVAAGLDIPEPTRGTWPVRIVQKTIAAFDAGYERSFDAVFVDEGQDFTVGWWNLLRHHVVKPDGEMLLSFDPTADLYGKQSWNDAEQLDAAGFDEPWVEMSAAYRMAPEIIESTNRFVENYLPDAGQVPEVPDDQAAVVGHVARAVRRWRNVDRVADLGAAIGEEVVTLLTERADLSPRDIVFLCEYHHDGIAAAAVIESAGFPVHHVYSRDPDERQQRKRQFSPDADAVKGCTVHSFKGWESPAVVLGIGMEERSRRLAYTSMTRVSSTSGGDSSYLVVVNADPRLADFRPTFETGAALPQPG